MCKEWQWNDRRAFRSLVYQYPVGSLQNVVLFRRRMASDSLTSGPLTRAPWPPSHGSTTALGNCPFSDRRLVHLGVL